MSVLARAVKWQILRGIVPLIATQQPPSTLDDGLVYWTGSVWGFSATTYINSVGWSNSSLQRRSAFFRYTNVAIPKDSQIIAAKLTIDPYFSYTTHQVNTKIRAVAQDNPSTITSGNDYVTRPRTVAYTDWLDVQEESAGVLFDSPDFKDVIQEIVNQAGWASGNALIIYWDDLDDRSSHVANNIRSPCDYTASPSRTVKLTITYNPAG